MTGYILKLIQGVLDFQDKADPCYFYYVEEILKELERLDPRDFIPEMRPRLIQSKVHLKGLLRREATNKTVDGELLDLYQILETYKGEGSREKSIYFLL